MFYNKIHHMKANYSLHRREIVIVRSWFLSPKERVHHISVLRVVIIHWQ